MADNIRGAPLDEDEPGLDLRPLLRLAAWGGGAFVAVAVVIAVGRSDSGERRAGAALASLTGAPTEQALRASGGELLARAEAEREARRMAEALRALAADRDRLANRVAALERSLEDLTGSIRRQAEAPRQVAPSPVPSAPSPAAPQAAAAPPTVAPLTMLAEPPVIATPRRDEPPPTPAVQVMASKEPPPPVPTETTAVAPPPPIALAAPLALAAMASAAPLAPITSPSAPPLVPIANVPRSGHMALIQSYATATSPVPPPAAMEAAAGSVAARTEFAVDLGTAGSVNALRGLWEKTRARQPAHLDGLRPLVSVRDGQRPGSTELRLVAGPLANASAAARLCATLVAAGIHCQPAVFDGQRLALR